VFRCGRIHPHCPAFGERWHYLPHLSPATTIAVSAVAIRTRHTRQAMASAPLLKQRSATTYSTLPAWLGAPLKPGDGARSRLQTTVYPPPPPHLRSAFYFGRLKHTENHSAPTCKLWRDVLTCAFFEQLRCRGGAHTTPHHLWWTAYPLRCRVANHYERLRTFQALSLPAGWAKGLPGL